MGQLSPCTTASEVHAPKTRVHALKQEKPLQWEAPALQLESSPCPMQPEKACMQQQRPSVAKNKF